MRSPVKIKSICRFYEVVTSNNVWVRRRFRFRFSFVEVKIYVFVVVQIEKLLYLREEEEDLLLVSNFS